MQTNNKSNSKLSLGRGVSSQGSGDGLSSIPSSSESQLVKTLNLPIRSSGCRHPVVNLSVILLALRLG